MTRYNTNHDYRNYINILGVRPVMIILDPSTVPVCLFQLQRWEPGSAGTFLP